MESSYNDVVPPIAGIEEACDLPFLDDGLEFLDELGGLPPILALPTEDDV